MNIPNKCVKLLQKLIKINTEIYAIEMMYVCRCWVCALKYKTSFYTICFTFVLLIVVSNRCLEIS